MLGFESALFRAIPGGIALGESAQFGPCAKLRILEALQKNQNKKDTEKLNDDIEKY